MARTHRYLPLSGTLPGSSFEDQTTRFLDALSGDNDDTKKVATGSRQIAEEAAGLAATARNLAAEADQRGQLAQSTADLALSTAEGKISEAPVDGRQYARKNAVWSVVSGEGGSGIEEAPYDGQLYGRLDGAWSEIIPTPLSDAVNSASSSTAASSKAAKTAYDAAINAQGTANNAQTTAQSASTAATSAQSTADTAASNASSALSTAQAAQNTADAKLSDAPSDNKQYARKNGAWDEVTATGGLTLSDAVNSTSSTTAASSKAVKTAYDAAQNASTAAGTAQSTADSAASNASSALSTAQAAQTTANSKLSDAPSDGKQYARKDGAWDEVIATGGGSGVSLSDSVTSTSSTTAASSKAVKTAYDAAVSASTAAGTAQTTANTAQSGVSSLLARTISTTAPLTGGGNLSANRTLAISPAGAATATTDGTAGSVVYAKSNDTTSLNKAATPAGVAAQIRASGGGGDFIWVTEQFPEVYVNSSTGNDVNSGTAGAPLRTISTGLVQWIQKRMFTAPLTRLVVNIPKDGVGNESVFLDSRINGRGVYTLIFRTSDTSSASGCQMAALTCVNVEPTIRFELLNHYNQTLMITGSGPSDLFENALIKLVNSRVIVVGNLTILSQYISPAKTAFCHCRLDRGSILQMEWTAVTAKTFTINSDNMPSGMQFLAQIHLDDSILRFDWSSGNIHFIDTQAQLVPTIAHIVSTSNSLFDAGNASCSSKITGGGITAMATNNGGINTSWAGDNYFKTGATINTDTSTGGFYV